MNVLITCAGRRNYLVDYFKEAVGAIGKVYASNSTPFSSALAIADSGFLLPEITRGTEYFSKLLDLCIEKKVSLIVPVFDLELPLLSKNKEILTSHDIFPLVSNFDVIDICFDKYRTHQFLIESGFPTIPTYVDLKSAISSIDNNTMSYPIIIKPRWGSGSIGIFEANDLEELQVFTKLCMRMIQDGYIYKSADQDKILYQCKIRGQEFGLDVVNDLQGNFQACFIKRKVSMRAGETDSSVTIDHPLLFELGRKLSHYLRHIGVLDVDVIVSENKTYIIELNPRFGGGYPFSHAAGANVPAAIIAWLENRSINNGWLKIEKNLQLVKGIEVFRCNHAE
jgi:carbamoyl-phosphate synthase large subunit